MSSISQIYFHILNTERRRVKMLPAWKRLWHWKKSKSTMFVEALARMSDLDIAKTTEDALGYRLPQFKQDSEALDKCSSLNAFQHDRPDNPQKLSSESNGIEESGRRFIVAKVELEKVAVDYDDSEVVMEVSSLSPSSSNLSAANASTLPHSQIASKMEIIARRLSVFSSPKNNSSILKLPSVQAHAVNDTELCEVVISGRNTDNAAGVGKSQQQQSGSQVVQREAADAGGDCAPPATTSRNAGVRTRTLAALALNPRGKNSISSLLADVRKPIETRVSNAFEKGHSPYSSEFTSPMPSALSQPGLGPGTQVAAPKGRLHVATEQIQISPPPPQSRSRSRNMHTATLDPPESAFIAPPPPPRSRSSSRARVSAGPQAQDDARSPYALDQVRSSPIAVVFPAAAAFQPPDAANHTSGGSVRAGQSSKKAVSRQPKKSPTYLLKERLHAEYEGSMQRMQREGTSFEEC
jgi:hypothetical protein